MKLINSYKSLTVYMEFMFCEEDMLRIASECEPWPSTYFEFNRSQDVPKLGKLLEELKSTGKARKDSELASLIDSVNYDGGKLSFDIRPGYHPSVKQYVPEGTTGPLLSVFAHLYSGGDVTNPEFYVFQVRGSKLPAPGQIQMGGAGFVDWGELPYQSAIRELEEEVLKKSSIDSSVCSFVESVQERIERVTQPERALDFLSFKLRTGDPNPLLSYVIFTESGNLANISEARDFDDFIISPTEPEDEVAKTMKVKFDDLEYFTERIKKSPGFYGPVHESITDLLECF
jgi:hypothetical protein